MAFCTTCGSEKPDNGACPICNSGAVAAPPPPPPAPVEQYQQQPQQQYQQPPQQQYQQQPQQYQQQQYAPMQAAQQSPLVIDAMSTIKKVLSPDPLEAIKSAVSSRVHSWVIVAGISIVLMALSVMLIPAGLSRMEFSGSEARMATDAFHEYVISRGGLFGYAALVFLASFVILAILSKGVFQISKVNTPFVTVLNLTAAALLPSAMAFTASIVAGFFYVQASFFLILVGSVISVVFLYMGIIQSAQFKKSPFWTFAGAYAVYALVMYFVYNWVGERIGMDMGIF